LARTDDGEFELVLGNVQLISVFLIVVILLGVFFSMGYIVGRNSVPAAVDAKNTPPGKSIVVEPPRSTSKDTEQAASTAAPPSPVESAPETKPASTPPAAAQEEPVKPEPSPAPPPQERKPEPPSARAAAATVDRPAAGRYWQVVSTSRPEAEIIAGAIAKKGFKAVVAPSTKEGFYRVLVGPVGDAADAAKTRTALEASGFKNPILQKY
jgi:cell division protein FtsN